MRLPSSSPLRLALLALLVGAATLPAQEEPVAAGANGVPVPKKTKHVQPVYPQEALAQGIRGIVILDIVLDTHGKVETTNVLRSVPGLDEAAIVAARQWEYEPTKLDGKPVKVRLTVPITFSLALPKLTRQSGVPDLRQGVTPAWPAGTAGGGLATAEVTLEPDGRIGVARIVDGDAPWSEALLAALKTWRFSPPPDDAVLSFRVEAEFVRGKGSEPNALVLRATGLQRSDLLAGSNEASPAAPASPQPTAPPAAAPPAAAPPETATETAKRTPPPAPAPPAAPTQAAPPPQAAPQAGAAPPPAATAQPGLAAPPQGSAAPPTTEVITAAAPPPVPESGVSAIRDVTLEPGVPDLTRGRRPVTPPFARLAGTTGSVEVTFSVSAGGTTSLQNAAGPDLLRNAAEQTVASWVFRRTRADRAYLLAVFTYGPDKGSAVVRPQAAPPPGQAPLQLPPPATAPAPTPPPPPGQDRG
jgi:TonB family protein